MRLRVARKVWERFCYPQLKLPRGTTLQRATTRIGQWSATRRDRLRRRDVEDLFALLDRAEGVKR